MILLTIVYTKFSSSRHICSHDVDKLVPQEKGKECWRTIEACHRHRCRCCCHCAIARKAVRKTKKDKMMGTIVQKTQIAARRCFALSCLSFGKWSFEAQGRHEDDDNECMTMIIEHHIHNNIMRKSYIYFSFRCSSQVFAQNYDNDFIMSLVTSRVKAVGQYTGNMGPNFFPATMAHLYSK